MIDLLEGAAVQYGDWRGTISADNTDFDGISGFLGVRDGFRPLAVDIFIHGGHQVLVAYGVPKTVGYADLEAIVASGSAIETVEIARVERDIEGHWDTNPPAPCPSR